MSAAVTRLGTQAWERTDKDVGYSALAGLLTQVALDARAVLVLVELQDADLGLVNLQRRDDALRARAVRAVRDDAAGRDAVPDHPRAPRAARHDRGGAIPLVDVASSRSIVDAFLACLAVSLSDGIHTPYHERNI